MDKSFQQETVGEDAHMKDMRSCHRYEEELYAKKEQGVSIVQRRERRSEGVYQGTIEKEIHSTIKVTTDGPSILCK